MRLPALRYDHHPGMGQVMDVLLRGEPWPPESKKAWKVASKNLGLRLADTYRALREILADGDFQGEGSTLARLVSERVREISKERGRENPFADVAYSRLMRNLRELANLGLCTLDEDEI